MRKEDHESTEQSPPLNLATSSSPAQSAVISDSVGGEELKIKDEMNTMS